MNKNWNTASITGQWKVVSFTICRVRVRTQAFTLLCFGICIDLHYFDFLLLNKFLKDVFFSGCFYLLLKLVHEQIIGSEILGCLREPHSNGAKQV